MTRASFVPLVIPLVVFSLASVGPLPVAEAQSGVSTGADETDQLRFSANQLDNLVGPIALYPDALLAQVLVASTFPDQVEDAARWVRSNGTSEIDDQPWDISVKSVAHYASALNMMADKSDWTATLGRAYANQSSDVMAAVQRMRRMADAQGNLVSTAQQQVVRDADNYVIVPAQPRVIYVPVYDPVVIYTRPIFNVGFSSRFWSFGVGFPIGGWLSYDLDWRGRSVYYNGWNSAFFASGGGWRARSRPFVQITNVYVHPRYRNVYVNRNVIHRTVNYRNVDRYVGVHRDTYFDRDGGRNGGRDRDRVRGGNGDDGRNRDGDRNRGFPYGSDLGRTAQPRAERPTATLEGYRNGSDRNAGDRERSRDPRENRGEPSERRREPVARANEMTISPELIRTPRGDGPRGDGSRGDGTRGVGARPSAPDEGRSDRPERSARPERSDRARESVRQPESPREARPRQAMPRGERSASEGNRSGRDRRGA